MDQEQKPRERSFIRELVPDWQPSRDQVLRAIRITVVAVVALTMVGILGVVLWIMLGKYIDPRTATERKDIVQSFALVVAGVVGSLTALAAVGNLYISRRNLQQQRELEEQRAQEEALPAYLEQIIQMLNDKDRPLYRSKEGDEVSIVATVRTLTTLPRLNGDRKRSVIQFLYEAGLINKAHAIVDLAGADLINVDLSNANLVEVNLRSADLSNANLRHANLLEAYLVEAKLSGADLFRANLVEANLSGADLSNANLDSAWLMRADLGESTESSLSAAYRPTSLAKANLSGADLSGANLNGADLSEANLREANLREANLTAHGITNEELERQAASLEGATMPDGQKYEDWLKSKGRGEDGENSGPSQN